MNVPHLPVPLMAAIRRAELSIMILLRQVFSLHKVVSDPHPFSSQAHRFFYVGRIDSKVFLSRWNALRPGDLIITLHVKRYLQGNLRAAKQHRQTEENSITGSWQYLTAAKMLSKRYW